jgi:tetratricopeptide (TPR) repeat protein
LNRDVLFSQAEEYEEANKWEEALDAYESLLEPNTQDIALLEKCAWCASRSAKYEKAIKYYNRLVNQQTHNAKWFYGIGYQYYMQKQWASANDWFQKALVIYPDYLVVKYRYGYSLRQLCGQKLVLTKDEYWKSLQQFKECESIWNCYTDDLKKQNAATYANICFQRGKLLIERNRIEEALVLFVTALSLSGGEFEECNYQASKAYLALGDAEKARLMLPKNSSKYYVKELDIEILLAEGKNIEAENSLNKLLCFRRKDYLYRRLCILCCKRGSYNEAYKYILEAEKLNPDNHLNIFEKASIYSQMGILLKAKAEAEKAMNIKQNKYSSEYKEARKLVTDIENIISSTNYKADDIDKLNALNLEASSGRIIGEVSSFNTDRGFGFITENNQKYFFHISSIPKSIQNNIKQGMKLYFNFEQTSKGKTATNISQVK